MVKRIAALAIVLAAFLIVAVPAFAANGARADYTTSEYCSICHKVGQAGGAPKVYNAWSQTAHGTDAEAVNAAKGLPTGSVCAGCHTANFAPGKVIPTPTATTWLPAPSSAIPSPVPTGGTVSWGAANGIATLPQSTGSAASSESDVGCSSCHYGAATGNIPQYGNDVNDTAHTSAFVDFANAEICGACHSRYSYAVAPISVSPMVPYLKVDATGSPIPNPSPTTLIQPQMAIGYAMIGVNFQPLSAVLNVPAPGWAPTPNPSATAAAGLMTYWKDANGNDLPWQAKGHEGSSAQYPEWKNEGLANGHADSLTRLKAAVGPNPPASCLKCHSTDYRIAVAAGKTPPTGAQTKYGITCVGCHTPHDAGTAKGVWDNKFDTQLITDSGQTLCVTCHNGEIPEGSTASPGAEVHNPTKEVMDGYGAIDVASFPSVHKGKCVQCHMPPTSYGQSTPQLGGNHTFKIITPQVAADVQPQNLGPSAAPVTMPYSACSTCHSRPGDNSALWLQDTIDQRQSWTKAKIVDINNALATAAKRLGYADEATARNALVLIPAAIRTTDQTTFLKAFTNVGYVASEGSFGIHNWDYSRAIVNTALVEAQSVKAAPKPWRITFKLSKARVSVNHKVKFSGTVKTSAMAPGTGRVTIQKKVSGHWKAWRTAKLNSKGGFAKTVKMTKKGTFYFRAFMPRHASNLKKASKSHKLIVK